MIVHLFLSDWFFFSLLWPMIDEWRKLLWNLNGALRCPVGAVLGVCMLLIITEVFDHVENSKCRYDSKNEIFQTKYHPNIWGRRNFKVIRALFLITLKIQCVHMTLKMKFFKQNTTLIYEVGEISGWFEHFFFPNSRVCGVRDLKIIRTIDVYDSICVTLAVR